MFVFLIYFLISSTYLFLYFNNFEREKKLENVEKKYNIKYNKTKYQKQEQKSQEDDIKPNYSIKIESFFVRKAKALHKLHYIYTVYFLVSFIYISNRKKKQNEANSIEQNDKINKHKMNKNTEIQTKKNNKDEKENLEQFRKRN